MIKNSFMNDFSLWSISCSHVQWFCFSLQLWFVPVVDCLINPTYEHSKSDRPHSPPRRFSASYSGTLSASSAAYRSPDCPRWRSEPSQPLRIEKETVYPPGFVLCSTEDCCLLRVAPLPCRPQPVAGVWWWPWPGNCRWDSWRFVWGSGREDLSDCSAPCSWHSGDRRRQRRPSAGTASRRSWCFGWDWRRTVVRVEWPTFRVERRGTLSWGSWGWGGLAGRRDCRLRWIRNSIRRFLPIDKHNQSIDWLVKDSIFQFLKFENVRINSFAGLK